MFTSPQRRTYIVLVCEKFTHQLFLKKLIYNKQHIFSKECKSSDFKVVEKIMIKKKTIMASICCAVMVSGACSFQTICDHSQHWQWQKCEKFQG